MNYTTLDDISIPLENPINGNNVSCKMPVSDDNFNQHSNISGENQEIYFENFTCESPVEHLDYTLLNSVEERKSEKLRNNSFSMNSDDEDMEKDSNIQKEDDLSAQYKENRLSVQSTSTINTIQSFLSDIVVAGNQAFLNYS